MEYDISAEERCSLEKVLAYVREKEALITVDSRKVVPGSVFVAVSGTVYDGHDFIAQALDRGAAYVVCSVGEHISSGAAVGVDDTRKALGYLAAGKYDRPTDCLLTYGVTGTNGKTTTVFLLDSILNRAGTDCGFISTVSVKTSGDRTVSANMTTPDPLTVNRYLSEMVEGGKRAAIVEISSHALDQKRVWGVGLDAAIFTNITPEHLDYHGDMKKYLRDKLKIFRQLKSGGVGIVNIDDPGIRGGLNKVDIDMLKTFSAVSDADVCAKDIILSMKGTEFILSVKGEPEVKISSPLIGIHNVYNMLGAAAALYATGMDIEILSSGLENAPHVPGRLEAVPSNAPFKVFVDYAHTPNALENVLDCLRPLAENRLICVFGCGGDRDRSKRPVMGSIAAARSDKMIITSDNPRTEEPGVIINEIESGVRGNTNYSIIEQRSKAIEEAVASALPGDIILIAGKGHEDYQLIGNDRIRFDDREEAGKALRRSGYFG